MVWCFPLTGCFEPFLLLLCATRIDVCFMVTVRLG
jgi:hypothetical protein